MSTIFSENFRAVRLVVDTGIHELGWTRPAGNRLLQAAQPAELPGGSGSLYSPGRRRRCRTSSASWIRELRAKAERELAARFDVRDFNDAVIRDGRLPLDLLTAESTGLSRRRGDARLLGRAAEDVLEGSPSY